MSSSKLLFSFCLALLSINLPGPSSAISTSSTNAFGITDVRAERVTYEWTIKHFSLLPEEKGDFIQSPIFRTENYEVSWKLRMYPQGHENDPSGYASVGLNLRTKSADSKIKVHCKLSVLKSDHQLANVTWDRTYDYNNASDYGLQLLKFKPEPLKSSDADDTVVILAEIDMPFRSVTESFKVSDPLEEGMVRDLGKNRLSDNFRSLLDESLFSDVVIVVGNSRFPADKLVLSARSPVFKSMFNDHQTNEINIEKMKPIVMNATLEFIYTDDVVDLEPLAFGLLEAADRFELPRLKTMCERVLYKTLNEDNAANILVLTDLHRSYKLKKHVMDFIAGRLSAVMNTEGYRKMEDTSPKLLKELLHSVGLKSSKNPSCEL